MEKVKISFLDLVNVLSEQEMKKVTGGCGSICNSGLSWVRCNNGNAGCTNDCNKVCESYGGVKDCWN